QARPVGRVVEPGKSAQYLLLRRVCARPAADSDPVRRQGPERGSTGGGGRPRSFPPGPPQPFGCGGPGGFLTAAPAKLARPLVSSPRAATTRRGRNVPSS